MLDYILQYTDAVAAISVASCGWLFAIMRRKELRMRQLEVAVQDMADKVDKELALQGQRICSIREDVTEIKGSVKMLVENQLRRV